MVQRPAADRLWYIAERWQYYHGERRANLLRLIAIGGFYTIHLLHYLSSLGRLPALPFLQFAEKGPLDDGFHTQVTMLALAWTMLCLGISLCLARGVLPWWLKYLSTGTDLLFLSAMLYLADGPRSPLVVAYFLIIAVATLRMSLPLVRFATAGSLIGYVCLLGCAKWPMTFGKGGVDFSVPRYHQLIVLLGLLLTGVVLGQVIRAVRLMAERFAGDAFNAGAEP